MFVTISPQPEPGEDDVHDGVLAPLGRPLGGGRHHARTELGPGHHAALVTPDLEHHVRAAAALQNS